MLKYFDKAFFRFMTGFLITLAASLVVLYIAVDSSSNRPPSHTADVPDQSEDNNAGHREDRNKSRNER
ncbi:MAG: hypothetical protein WD312_01405 [Candidatus Paceibacterota bacterium]